MEDTNTDINFKQQMEWIKAELLRQIGPVSSISKLGAHDALPAKQTIRNLRSIGGIPENIFFRGPTGILVDTEKFLDWWASRCTCL